MLAQCHSLMGQLSRTEPSLIVIRTYINTSCIIEVRDSREIADPCVYVTGAYKAHSKENPAPYCIAFEIVHLNGLMHSVLVFFV